MVRHTWLTPLLIVIFCLFLQFISRYVPAPVTDLVLDDWACLERAGDYVDYSDLVASSWKEKSRPLLLFSTIGLFKYFGDQPFWYATTSIVMYSFILALLIVVVYLLSKSWYVSLLAGVIFSVLPNLTESFHWGQLTGMSWVYVADCAAIILWILFIRTHKIGYLVGSVICYGASIFGYEISFALPFAFVFLIDRSQWKKQTICWLVFPAMALLYLSWRFTNIWGVKHYIQTFNSTKEGADIFTMIWNVRQVIGWWLGDNLLKSIANGWMGFTVMNAKLQYMLITANIVFICIFIGLVIVLFQNINTVVEKKKSHIPALMSSYPIGQLLLFSLAFIAVTCAPSLVSWTSGRQNYLPGMGVAILVALVLYLLPRKIWLSGFVVCSFVFLVANQGTNVQWQESGIVSRRLYDYHKRTVDEWRHYPILLYDTERMRERMFFSPTCKKRYMAGNDAWTHNGNAGLLRGFVLSSMVSIILNDEQVPESIFDVEYGAYKDGNSIFWHERFDQDKPRVNALSDVYTFECGVIIANAAWN